MTPDLRDELADALAGSLEVVAVLRLATLMLARRPSAVDAEREALRASLTGAPPRLTGARRIVLEAVSDLPPALSLATRLGTVCAAAWEHWVETGDALAYEAHLEAERLAREVPACDPSLWLD
jgi:hypothetical protein